MGLYDCTPEDVAKRVAANHLAGLVEPPPRMVKAIVDWEEDTTEMEAEFPTDLRGWKHLGERPWAPVTPGAKQALIGAQSIRVVLDYGLRSGGQFLQGWNNPSIRLNPGLPDIETTVKHELRHFAQWLLGGGRLSGGEGKPSRRIQTPEFSQHGLNVPEEEASAVRRRLYQLGVPPKGVHIHALDDIEFYTDLADAIETFKHLARGLPPAAMVEALHFFTGSRRPPRKHDLETRFRQELLDKDPYGPTSEPEVERQVRQQVQVYLKQYKAFTKPSPFFLALLRGAVGKWRKAVGELAVAALGQEPSALRVASRWLAGDYGFCSTGSGPSGSSGCREPGPRPSTHQAPPGCRPARCRRRTGNGCRPAGPRTRGGCGSRCPVAGPRTGQGAPAGRPGPDRRGGAAPSGRAPRGGRSSPT